MQAAHGLIFAIGHAGQRLTATLTGDDDNAAPAGLVPGATTIVAMLFVVGRSDVAARALAGRTGASTRRVFACLKLLN